MNLSFYSYHFVRTILSNDILSVYHFVRYHFVRSPSAVSFHLYIALKQGLTQDNLFLAVMWSIHSRLKPATMRPSIVTIKKTVALLLLFFCPLRCI